MEKKIFKIKSEMSNMFENHKKEIISHVGEISKIIISRNDFFEIQGKNNKNTLIFGYESLKSALLFYKFNELIDLKPKPFLKLLKKSLEVYNKKLIFNFEHHDIIID